jgi:eukaryotic-like serine/threonine-protein kinase
MGTVYLAMSGHREMETLCVVKRLLPALASQPDHVRRFRHEADLARRLVHGNLVHTHNIGEVNGEVFLVQEFVEGHDVSAMLDELAAQRRTLPVPVAVYIASEIARGLAYAHDFEDLDLVHRDINPPNVRLTYSGEVKLLDFGIASSNLHGDAHSQQRGAGKLWHLAPEQVRPGQTIDRRTDIYALGVVLWELLTQRPVGTVRQGDGETRLPETEGEVLVWITRGQHQRPSLFNPDVPPELDALVAKATSVNADDRHPSADDFRHELAAFIPAAVHPELALAALMKEFFSPEEERLERRRMIESARHLLGERVGRRRMDASSSDGPKTATARRRREKKKLPPWLVPAAAGAILATGAILWLRPAPPSGDSAKPAGVARLSQRTPTPPAPSPRAPSAAVPAPPLAARVPSASPPPSATGSAPATAPLLSRIDHLLSARNAFNARFWERALSEGKIAIAAGGGAEAHALVGNTYFKMGRFAEAEQAYTQAVALDPGNTLLQDRLRIAHVRAQERKGGKEP